MRERYCFEKVTRLYENGAYHTMNMWAIIDRRQGYRDAIGYIPEAANAQKLVDLLNSGIADVRVQSAAK